MPDRTVRVFVSYSHQDSAYLADDELLGFLRGLERDDAVFWTDRDLIGGDGWDAAIRAELARSDIALALVSQRFLDSRYCTDVEIRQALEQRSVVLPILLSPCDWPDHEWLSSRQFLPDDGRSIELDFTDLGERKALYLTIRRALKTHIDRLRDADTAVIDETNPFTDLGTIHDPARFVGRANALRQLDRTLRGGASVALVGDPKIGKSSLVRRLVETWDDGDVLGPFDLQAMEDRDDVYDHLASALQLDSGSWRSIREALRHRRSLLILDEADSGADRVLDGSDLGRFRAVMQHNPGFRLLTLSRGPLKAAFPDPRRGSPPYNLSIPQTLGALDGDEVDALLAHPWAPDARPFAPETIEEIVGDLAKERLDRHPFWLQRAAHHRFEALLDPQHEWAARWRVEREHLG